MGWAEERLAEARAMMDLPALAHGDAVLMHRTKLHNTFTCQPQQRNMHGRVFGGFLMRRAALSHSTHASTWAVLKDIPQSIFCPMRACYASAFHAKASRRKVLNHYQYVGLAHAGGHLSWPSRPATCLQGPDPPLPRSAK